MRDAPRAGQGLRVPRGLPPPRCRTWRPTLSIVCTYIRTWVWNDVLTKYWQRTRPGVWSRPRSTAAFAVNDPDMPRSRALDLRRSLSLSLSFSSSSSISTLCCSSTVGALIRGIGCDPSLGVRPPHGRREQLEDEGNWSTSVIIFNNNNNNNIFIIIVVVIIGIFLLVLLHQEKARFWWSRVSFKKRVSEGETWPSLLCLPSEMNHVIWEKTKRKR